MSFEQLLDISLDEIEVNAQQWQRQDELLLSIVKQLNVRKYTATSSATCSICLQQVSPTVIKFALIIFCIWISIMTVTRVQVILNTSSARALCIIMAVAFAITSEYQSLGRYPLRYTPVGLKLFLYLGIAVFTTQTTTYAVIYCICTCIIGAPLFKLLQWLLRTDRRPTRRQRTASAPVNATMYEESTTEFEMPTESTPKKIENIMPRAPRRRRSTLRRRL